MRLRITTDSVILLRSLNNIKVKVKCLYLYWITLSATEAVLPRGPVRSTPHGSSVTTGGNRSTRRKPEMLGRVKLDNTRLTCDQGNFSHITARSQNRTLVTVMRDTCTTTVPPASQVCLFFFNQSNSYRNFTFIEFITTPKAIHKGRAIDTKYPLPIGLYLLMKHL